MSQPLINYVSWKSVVPPLLAAAVLILLAHYVLPLRDLAEAFAVGGGIFVVYTFGSRFFIASDNRRGLKAMARQDFDAALEHFGQSYAYFSKHSWLDRYRSITLMSSSLWSYREIALMNILTVHVRKKDFAAATRACRRVLEEFPDNQIAQSTYEMLTSDHEERPEARE